MTIAAIVAVFLHAALARPQPHESPPWAEFGISVAALSDTIFVAASPMKSGTRGPGEIHVFQRRTSGWGRAHILSVPAATVEDLFGVSMAADDDTLVVGAQFADTHGEDAGMAYVFERRNASWHQVGVLAASDAAAGDQFGLTVSVSGDTIVVGARLADSRAGDTGAAYVFGRKNGTWHQVGKLVASDAASGDIFGRVSVDQDAMVLSADLNDDRGSNAGKAYAFQNRGGVWDEVARLTASDGAAGDEFGISLALKGGTAVFGALGSGGDGSGAAYVFERRDGRWAQLARLRASDAARRQGFGFSVAVGHDTIVVGAPNHSSAGESTGAAYVFEQRVGGWTQAGKLTASDAAPLTGFGSTVAIHGNTIVIGMLFNGDGKRAGTAYVFERHAGTWSEAARLIPEERVP